MSLGGPVEQWDIHVHASGVLVRATRVRAPYQTLSRHPRYKG